MGEIWGHSLVRVLTLEHKAKTLELQKPFFIFLIYSLIQYIQRAVSSPSTPPNSYSHLPLLQIHSSSFPFRNEQVSQE